MSWIRSEDRKKLEDHLDLGFQPALPLGISWAFWFLFLKIPKLVSLPRDFDALGWGYRRASGVAKMP